MPSIPFPNDFTPLYYITVTSHMGVSIQMDGSASQLARVMSLLQCEIECNSESTPHLEVKSGPFNFQGPLT